MVEMRCYWHHLTCRTKTTSPTRQCAIRSRQASLSAKMSTVVKASKGNQGLSKMEEDISRVPLIGHGTHKVTTIVLK